MKLRKVHFLIVLLILSALLSGGPNKGFLHSCYRLPSMRDGVKFFSPDHGKTFFYSQGNAASGHSGSQVEKHHHRTIAPEAIIADFAIPPTQFAYCSRNYCFFLSGGCSQTTLGNSFLRGPPFCS